MPRRAAGLTVKQVETKPPGLYADGGNLYLKVTPSGTRSWVFRYTAGDRRRDMGLGPYPDVTLAEARELATDARRQRLKGVDPLDAKGAAKAKEVKAMTFRQCADAYIAAHQVGWKNPKSESQWSGTLRDYAYPVMGKLPVDAVDVGLVLKAVEPIWSTKPETASRVRGRIEAVLDWATARGYRQGDNPARWKGHLDALLPAKTKVRRVEHHAALPYGEVAAFIAELRGREGLTARALEFVILTAARTGEVFGATWAEFDLEGRTWTIPAARMKGGREHKVPLSAPALALLRALPQGAPGERPFGLTETTIFKLLERMGRRGEITAHGFRSTFSDWCAEMTAFPSEVREMALAHVVGDKVEAAYRRGDLFQKRRQLADAWATFCTSPGLSGDVVPIRG